MTTKARVRSSISAFFRFLLSRKIITTNPCEQLGSIKLPVKEPGYLTPQQCLALMEAAKQTSSYYKHRDLVLIQLLLKSGLRRAEVVSLNIEDVNLEQASLRVVRKGGKYQSIPLHSELVANLGDYLEWEDRLTGPLFMSKRGNRLSASQLWHIVKKYAQIPQSSPLIRSVIRMLPSYCGRMSNLPISRICSVISTSVLLLVICIFKTISLEQPWRKLSFNNG